MTFFREALRIYLLSQEGPTGASAWSVDHKKYNRREYSDMARKERKYDIGGKYVRYKAGAEIYGVCQSTFRKWANDAKAVIRVNKVCMVSIEKVDQYLKSFCVED